MMVMKKLVGALITLSLFGSAMAFATAPGASTGHIDGRAKCGLAACYAGGAGIDGYAPERLKSQMAGGAGVDGYVPERPKSQTAFDVPQCAQGHHWSNGACVPYVFAGGSGNGGGYEG
jgi:hypothetical protein